MLTATQRRVFQSSSSSASIQFIGERDDFECQLDDATDASHLTASYVAYNGHAPIEPIVYAETAENDESVKDSVTFYPQAMEPRHPYAFRFLNHYMAVIKDSAGELHVFYFP